MCKKITKAGLISRLEIEGYTVAEAEKFLGTLSGIISKELCLGNSVILTEVGVLTAVVKDSAPKSVGGIEKLIPQHLNVKFKMSKFLRDRYKTEFSTKGKTDTELKKLGSTFKNLLK